ncbi:TIGR04282 family arsenosugar biosynthesis glycosyltransferase [Kutzneria chonburiensis]|uniref:DUF2064 domain-containing protein n=1 Tax=Kutzneria chonburiensis TaxID=1483604 RepID=A0ABV6N475_9PSEU|nr:DUF2064 domain-containing protein [Kutzneria chonburiensis]
MTDRAGVLVVAKAPVPGLAKTRLTPAATPEQAAEVAAASLLDTLDAVLSVPRVRRVVAMTGDLEKAAQATELRRVLRWFDVIPQRGNNFAERLVNAHRDVADLPVVQIGMDTPQVTPWLLGSAIAAAHTGDAALGLAEDGGWWALGLKDPLHAMALQHVPMSQPDTGSRTLDALHDLGLHVSPLPMLSDVDTIDDARRVAASVPGSRFAAAVAAISTAGQPIS